jgi:hypothetical protein
MRNLRTQRAALGSAFILGVVVTALIATTIVAVGAKSPAAARWNHRGATGVRTEAQAEAAIPPALIWQEIQVIEEFGTKLAGDYVVVRDRLLNPNSGKQVGTIDVTCMSGFADMCRGVVRLNNRGQITFDGMTPLGSDPDRYSIVGGHGNFADVGGVMRVDFPADDHALLTLTLTH